MRVDKVLVGLSVLVLLGCQGVPEPPVTVSQPLFSSGFEQGLEGWEVEAGGPTLRAEAEVEPLVMLAAQLTELKESGPDVLAAYLRNVRLDLFKKAKNIYLETPDG